MEALNRPKITPEVFMELWRKKKALWIGYARKWLPDCHKDEAEDVVQEALVEAVKECQSVTGNPEAWFYTVLTNKVRDFVRLRANRIAKFTGETVDIPSQKQKQTDAVDEADVIEQVVGRLSPDTQRLIRFLFEDSTQSIEELGAELGCSRSTVYDRLRNAKLQFRKQYFSLLGQNES